MDADLTTAPLSAALPDQPDVAALRAAAERARAGDLSEPGPRRAYAAALRELAQAQHAAGDWAGLRQTYEDGDAFRRGRALTGDLDAVDELATALEGWGRLLLGCPHLPVSASECLEEAVVLRRALEQRDPERYGAALAHLLAEQARSVLAHGLPDAAVDPAREAADRYRELAPHRATVAELAAALVTLTEALAGARSRRARRSALGVAEEAVRCARTAHPDHPGLLAAALAARATALAVAGRAEAVLVADEAVAIERARRAADPATPPDDLVHALDALAEALAVAGRYEEATEVLREAARLGAS